QSTQRDAALLAARQGADLRFPRRQPQRIRRDLELALQLPAAGGIDGVLQLRLAREEGIHFLLLEGLGEAVADAIEFLDQPQRLRHAFLDRAAHVTCRVELWLLRQIADADAALRARLAVDLLVDAGHDLEQRGLAGPVEPEHADLGAGKEREADVAQNDALRGDELANPLHGKDVLGHFLSSLDEAAAEYYHRLAASWAGLCPAVLAFNVSAGV